MTLPRTLIDATSDCPTCGHPMTEQPDTITTEVWAPDGIRLQCDLGHQHVTTWTDGSGQWGDLEPATSRPMNRRERRRAARTPDR